MRDDTVLSPRMCEFRYFDTEILVAVRDALNLREQPLL